VPDRVTVELDHIIVFCAQGAPEAEALIRAGLKEGSPNLHPGQGTACRRFFFDNAYLELVWVGDPEEAQREPVRATGLWDHWSGRERGACPFGLVLRSAGSAPAAEPPFATWQYRPTYLPPPLAIDVAVATAIEEPLLFYLAFQRGPAQMAAQPRGHRLPLGTVTRVSIGRPDGSTPSSAMARAQTFEWLSVHVAQEHVVDVTFDHGRSRETLDLRPLLPVILRW
jgi:hypothetical protein